MGSIREPTCTGVLMNRVIGLPPGTQTLPKGTWPASGFFALMVTGWYSTSSCFSWSKLQVTVEVDGLSWAGAAQAIRRTAENRNSTKRMQYMAGPPSHSPILAADIKPAILPQLSPPDYDPPHSRG